MHTCLDICCPNCGSPAHRHLFDEGLPICYACPDQQVAQTECPVCDYLLVMCWQSGKVVEAYAPGIEAIAMPPTPPIHEISTQRFVMAAIASATPAKLETISVSNHRS